jgi:N-acetylglucosamine kinase-like BadF-type ATPase
VAALGAVVQAAAEAGDAVALGLLDTAANDLVAHVVALRPHFAETSAVPVALSGGALRQGRPLRRQVVTLLGVRAPWATVRDVTVDAAVGAARMALLLNA